MTAAKDGEQGKPAKKSRGWLGNGAPYDLKIVDPVITRARSGSRQGIAKCHMASLIQGISESDFHESKIRGLRGGVDSDKIREDRSIRRIGPHPVVIA